MLEFYPAPPSVRQRIVSAVVTVMLAVVAVNDYADFHWFGGFDKQVLGGAMIIGVIWVVRFMPSVREKTD